MTREEIVSRLVESDVAVGFSVLFSDDTYSPVALRWLQRDFYPWFKAKLSAQGLAYTRRHDCDNFARKFCVYAQDAHALTVGTFDDAVAVGEFWYVSQRLGPHAIVAAFVENRELIFLEPQTGELLNLTSAEKQSCTLALF